jgi:peptide/nickel transport system permease protein
MGRFITRRLLWAVFVLLAVSLLSFLTVHLTGDPTALYVSMEGTQEDYEILRHAMGFDRPLYEQYWSFLSKAVRGDFGNSLRRRSPALPLVLAKLPTTIQLTLAAMFLGVIIAVPLGTISAIKKGSVLDTMAMVGALSGQSIPTFWLGIMLIVVFSVHLRWLPSFGKEGWKSIILPTLTLAAWAAARTARLTRSAVLEVLMKDYMRTARAKGLRESRVIIGHTMRNAAIPIVTAIGLDMGNLLGGAIITEAVFAYPGVGLLAVQSVINKDIPLIQAVVCVVATMLVALNLGVDVLYGVLDPRIRLD